MEKVKSKLSFLTALNAIFLQSDNVISEEEKNEMQINSINSSTELSEEDKSLLIKSLNGSIKKLEDSFNNSKNNNVAEKVKVNSVKAVAEATKKLENVKNGNEIEDKEKN